MLAKVATRDEKNPLVEVALEATRLVVEALVIVALVVVELPTIKLVMLAKVATRDEMKELVLVLFVEVKSAKLPFPQFCSLPFSSSHRCARKMAGSFTIHYGR